MVRSFSPSVSTKIPDGMDQDSISGVPSNYLCDIQGGLPASGGRSREPSSKQTVAVVSPCKDQLMSSLFGTEGGCIIQACDQLEPTKLFHPKGKKGPL